MEIIRYIKSSYKEVVEKVTWSPLKKVQDGVIVVALFSVIFSLFVSGVDFILKEVIRRFFESF